MTDSTDPNLAQSNAQRAAAIAQGLSLSLSGRVGHGERIDVPWGTIHNWSIIVGPASAGVTELGDEFDNALLRFEVEVTPDGLHGWRFTAIAHFRYAYTDERSDSVAKRGSNVTTQLTGTSLACPDSVPSSRGPFNRYSIRF